MPYVCTVCEYDCKYSMQINSIEILSSVELANSMRLIPCISEPNLIAVSERRSTKAKSNFLGPKP